MNLNKLAFVDLETTGISPSYERIIEIGIVILENGKIKKKYSKLVDPEMRIGQFITKITGIRNEDLESAPTFHQIAHEVADLLEGCVFVAHNVRFDYGFLKAELERAGNSFNMPHFCTARLSRRLFPEERRHGLDYLIRRHNLKCENRHRALDDARAICDFYKLQLKRLGEEKLLVAIKELAKRISWPALIPKEEILALPDTPGVYVFYGENNAPLYVGKSVNIRTRVISHFSEDIRSAKEMKLGQSCTRIEAFPTAGELGALIKESQMVKDLLPLYNQRLRKSEQLTVLKVGVDSAGYKQIEITNTHEHEISPEDIQDIYGVFRSKLQATKALQMIAEEHRLCKKHLGLEKTKRSCFGYQLKKCGGACIGEEPANLFNARFDIAFINLKFKKWPYEQPVRVVEESNGVKDAFVLDKWCVFRLDESGERMIEENFRFDLDVYKILKTFLRNPKNLQFIRSAV